VAGELPSDFRDRFLQALGQHGFKDIEIASDQEESLGWVNVSDPFDTAFDLNKVLWNDYLLVTLRHDSIRISPSALKLYLKREIAEYLTKTGKERASKAEQEEVRDHLVKQLRKRLLPAIKTYDVVWNIQRQRLWFFTTNKRVNEVFVEVFNDTFGLMLVPKSPYALLEQMDDPALLEASIAIEPANLAVPNR
jgi:hypothetical protein